MSKALHEDSSTTEVTMRLLIVTACLIVLLIPAESHGEKYAGEFMALGGGARAMGMGGAFTALADDATASFWNPAGIARVPSMLGLPHDWEVTLMHSERFGDLIDYNFVSAVFPLSHGESGWGLTFIHMGIDDIPITPGVAEMVSNSDGDDIFEPREGEGLINYRDFPLESANDFALFLSYAQYVKFGAVGGTVKLLRNDQITDVSSFGIGLDLGLIMHDLWRRLSLGVKLQDATGTYISWSTGKKEFIYPTLKVGLAYPLPLNRMNSTLVLAVDGDFRYENLQSVSQLWIGRASLDVHLGAELVIREIVALRGGLDMGRPTAGAGFILQKFGPWDMTLGLDYALLIHDVLDTTHRVSLLLAH